MLLRRGARCCEAFARKNVYGITRMLYVSADGVNATSVHKRRSTVPAEETNAVQVTLAPGLDCGEAETAIEVVAPVTLTVVSLQPTLVGAVAETVAAIGRTLESMLKVVIPLDAVASSPAPAWYDAIVAPLRSSLSVVYAPLTTCTLTMGKLPFGKLGLLCCVDVQPVQVTLPLPRLSTSSRLPLLLM